ncbi:MAG: MaoC/PaaZ C-terminal domain-containing protein [Desulfatiglandaceae bacterium]
MSEVDLSVIGKKTEPVIFEYTWKDVVLYALGVGASAEDLDFVYERVPGGLKVLPSFCVVPAMRAYPHVGDKVDWSRFLHGEQTIRVPAPLPTEGRFVVVGEVTDIYDKGKAAVYHIKISGQTEDGHHSFDTYWVNFYVGAGGFGGDPGPKSEILSPPEDTEPDYSISSKVTENQAALYRLNGDLNPLHLDPEFARQGGFDKPILHGLCTYGFTVRAIVNDVLNGEVERLKSFRARFSSVVYPGDTLTTRCWMQNGGAIIQVETDRGVALSNALCEFA